MASFVYTAWFRDPDVDPDDQDYEWPACIRLNADTAEAARRWGDILARERARRPPSAIFLHSAAEEDTGGPEGNPHDLPTVSDGENATDEQIGW